MLAPLGPSFHVQFDRPTHVCALLPWKGAAGRDCDFNRKLQKLFKAINNPFSLAG